MVQLGALGSPFANHETADLFFPSRLQANIACVSHDRVRIAGQGHETHRGMRYSRDARIRHVSHDAASIRGFVLSPFRRTHLAGPVPYGALLLPLGDLRNQGAGVTEELVGQSGIVPDIAASRVAVRLLAINLVVLGRFIRPLIDAEASCAEVDHMIVIAGLRHRILAWPLMRWRL